MVVRAVLRPGVYRCDGAEEATGRKSGARRAVKPYSYSITLSVARRLHLRDLRSIRKWAWDEGLDVYEPNIIQTLPDGTTIIYGQVHDLFSESTD